MRPVISDSCVHHVAISVRDVDKTVDFYARLGFVEKLRWVAEDRLLTIVHLQLKRTFLEVFCYSKNSSLEIPDISIGNELEAVGVKHMALSVPDLKIAKSNIDSVINVRATQITSGRTGIDYFFVQDPDGLWVEIVQDKRRI